MNLNRIIVIASVLAILLAAIALWKAIAIERTITKISCLKQLDNCKDDCGDIRDSDLDRIQIEAYFAQEHHTQELFVCNQISNPILRQQCIDAENARFTTVANGFAQRRQQVRLNYARCRVRCAENAEACENRGKPQPGSGGITIDVPGDCKGEDRTDEVCMRRIDPFCLRAASCEDCLRTLCPGTDWEFESTSPIDIKLVAAVSEKDAERVIASATAKDKNLVLTAPKDIKLSEGENLFFSFKPKAAQEDNITVTVYHR